MDLKIPLAPELDAFVKERVANGRNDSAADVVVEALRLLVDTERDDAAKLAWLRQAWAEGEASGEPVEADFDAIRAAAMRRLGG